MIIFPLWDTGEVEGGTDAEAAKLVPEPTFEMPGMWKDILGWVAPLPFPTVADVFEIADGLFGLEGATVTSGDGAIVVANWEETEPLEAPVLPTGLEGMLNLLGMGFETGVAADVEGTGEDTAWGVWGITIEGRAGFFETWEASSVGGGGGAKEGRGPKSKSFTYSGGEARGWRETGEGIRLGTLSEMISRRDWQRLTMSVSEARLFIMTFRRRIRSLSDWTRFKKLSTK